MKHRQSCHRQLDLFVAKTPPAPIAPAERTKLLPLVTALLSEARGAAAATEAGDEDHV
ncbi:hypothetical protein [Mesorhizobium sp. M0254]|uniref:hypothetical protein n=1 Tax=Mesorhizobium sp. M0254 TaxID=2956927 RepID=UPI00333DE6B9